MQKRCQIIKLPKKGENKEKLRNYDFPLGCKGEN